MADAGPRSRNLPAAAFDSRRGVLVVCGGAGIGSGTRFGDTWEWDGREWREIHVRTPGPRDHHAMAYDSARAKVAMFGGSEAGTWTWDGQSWAKTDSSAEPATLVHHAMAYDAARKRVVLFGGSLNAAPYSAQSDTWEWDGTRWEKRP